MKHGGAAHVDAGQAIYTPRLLRHYDWFVLMECNMHEIEDFEAMNKFAALIDAAVRGEEVIITRGGKPVAKLVRHDPAVVHARAANAAERIRAIRKGLTLGGLKIKDLIEEGR